jgi:hypothetical protein
MFDVVISRYNEDIAWSDNILRKKYIYNKGEHSVSPDEILLDNVGREAHTYLFHIVNNYHNLESHTLFLQGNPMDHGFPDNFTTPTLLNSINFSVPFFPLLRAKDNYKFLTCNNYGAPDHNLDIKTFLHNHNIYNIDHVINFEFVQGAQFAVSRDAIRSRPLETYRKLLITLTDPTQEIHAHTMERLWKYIFNCY